MHPHSLLVTSGRAGVHTTVGLMWRLLRFPCNCRTFHIHVLSTSPPPPISLSPYLSLPPTCSLTLSVIPPSPFPSSPPDIHDFYSFTLESTAKSTETKTEETLTLAERWEKHPPPVPSDTANLAAKSLEVRVSSTTD